VQHLAWSAWSESELPIPCGIARPAVMPYFISSAYNPGLVKLSALLHFAPSAHSRVNIFQQLKRRQRTKLAGTAQNAGRVWSQLIMNLINLWEKIYIFSWSAINYANSIAGLITERQSFQESTDAFVGNKRIQSMTLGWHLILAEKNVVAPCLGIVAMSASCCAILGRVQHVLSYWSIGTSTLERHLFFLISEGHYHLFFLYF